MCVDLMSMGESGRERQRGVGVCVTERERERERGVGAPYHLYTVLNCATICEKLTVMSHPLSQVNEKVPDFGSTFMQFGSLRGLARPTHSAFL